MWCRGDEGGFAVGIARISGFFTTGQDFTDANGESGSGVVKYAFRENSGRDVPQDDHGRAICTAVVAQSNIGWEHLFKGRMAFKWHKAQAIYYREHFLCSKTLSGGQWMTRVVRGLW